MRARDDASVLIVMGTARRDGNTALAVDFLRQRLGPSAALVDLASLTIEPFSYDRSDDRDDFRAVVDRMLAHAHIVFATPVYWYAMSGVMKTFFDRLTDLLRDEADRPIGRALAGRDVWLLATGTGEALPPGFHEPFARTAAYFGMRWQQAFYVRSVKGASSEADELECLGSMAMRLRARMKPQVGSGAYRAGRVGLPGS